MRCTVFLLALFCSTMLMADGIPFNDDRRHLRGDHTVLELTDQQKIDVARRRRLTLTEEQLHILRAISPHVPANLPVLSSRYEDCTCDMGPTAVWCRPDEIDIPHFLLRDKSEPDDAPTTRPIELASLDAWESITIDSQGRMTRDDQKLTEKSMHDLIEKLAQHPQADRTLSISLPPLTGTAVDKQIDDQIQRIRRQCAAGKIKLRTAVCADLILDAAGQFFQSGLPLTDDAALALATRMAQRQVTENDRRVYIHLPPPMGAAADKRLDERLRRIKDRCEKQGVTVSIGG